MHFLSAMFFIAKLHLYEVDEPNKVQSIMAKHRITEKALIASWRPVSRGQSKSCDNHTTISVTRLFGRALEDCGVSSRRASGERAAGSSAIACRAEELFACAPKS